jgi:hypothetical protein
MRQPRRQIRMVTVNAGIGNGHQRAESGPASGIGIAEARYRQRRLPLAGIVFGRFVEGRIRNGSGRWRAAYSLFGRIGPRSWRRSSVFIVFIVFIVFLLFIGESVGAVDKDNRPGRRQTATTTTGAGAKKQRKQQDHQKQRE